MVYSRLPLLWAAILCCAANAEPLAAPAGMSRVLLNISSSTTSLQQDVATSSPTTLPSSSCSSSSSISISSSVTITPSASSITSTPSSNTIVWSPLAPPPTPSLDPSTTQLSSSDGGSGSYLSPVSNSKTVQRSGGDIASETSLSTTLATATIILPSDGKGGVTQTGAPLKSTGNPASASSAVDPTLVQDSTTLNIPTPPAVSSPGFTASNNDTTQSVPTITYIRPSLQLNASSTTPLSSKYRNPTSTRSHSSAHHNVTSIHTETSSHHTKSTHKPTASHHHHNTSTTCTPWTTGETITIWSIVPNTNTITITLTGNQSNTYTSTPEFTPPIPVCTPEPNPSNTRTSSSATEPLWGPHPSPSSSTIVGVGESTGAADSTRSIQPHHTSAPESASETVPLYFVPPPVTTAVITSKNPVTQFTTVSPPSFPGGGKTDRQSAQVTTSSKSTVLWPPLPPSPANNGGDTPVTTSPPTTAGSNPVNGAGPGSGGGSSPGVVLPVTLSTVNVGGVTVVVGPSSVAIGGQTVFRVPQGSSTTVTEGGKTFTVNPSQVIGPGTVVAIPTTGGGGVFMENPTPTVVDGVSVSIGNGIAMVGGSTYAIGAGAPEETIEVNKEKISIGPGGVGFADVTITPPAVLPTNVVLFDGQVFSAVGASVAVFDGSSITFTGGTPQTTVFNGDTITIGPEGVIDGTSTLGGPNHPTGTQLGIAGGIQVSEIGSTIAVIDGTTLTVGPGATEMTAIVDGKTITATNSGLIIDGSTTLSFPFNPTTQEVTAGGITFSEIGSSLVDIGGTTFTIGPGATPTTDVYNGQTISLGPGGIGFATTTITSFTSSSTATTSGKKKNGGTAIGPPFGGILGGCIALGVGLLM